MTPPGGLEGRVAIVTGGIRGLGAAMTERLARDGAHVCAGYLSDVELARSFAATLNERGLSVSVHQVDVADPNSSESLVADVLSRFGRVDHLVNNAALNANARIIDTTAAQWDAVVRTDLSGVFYLTKAVLPTMIEAGFGRVVTIGSIAAVKGSNWQGAYSAAKAGVIGFTRTLAREVARYGITANVILSGSTSAGKMHETSDPEVIAALVKLIPLRRLGEASEIAYGVRFLVDDEAAYVTGVVLPVDGGFSM